MITALKHLTRRLFAHKPKRLELKLATFAQAERLLKQGWTLAPEEDQNQCIGLVYLELLETRSETPKREGLA